MRSSGFPSPRVATRGARLAEWNGRREPPDTPPTCIAGGCGASEPGGPSGPLSPRKKSHLQGCRRREARPKQAQRNAEHPTSNGRGERSQALRYCSRNLSSDPPIASPRQHRRT